MKLVVMIIAVLAGCAGASYQTIRLENKTSRPIEAVYVYPIGSANHGASQRALAPNEAGEIKVRAGHVEVMAVSAKVEIDRHTARSTVGDPGPRAQSSDQARVLRCRR